MQYLYLIRNGESWLFKIGIAQDVESRLAQLQTGNPVDLLIESCYEFPSADHVEKVLHQKWNSVRKRGEWFDLNARDLDQFEEICTLLGGVPYVPDSEISTPDEVEEAEEQVELLGGLSWRIERRNDRTPPGFAAMERGAGKKCLGYISGSSLKNPAYPTVQEVESFLEQKYGASVVGNMPVSRKDEE